MERKRPVTDRIMRERRKMVSKLLYIILWLSEAFVGFAKADSTTGFADSFYNSPPIINVGTENIFEEDVCSSGLKAYNCFFEAITSRDLYSHRPGFEDSTVLNVTTNVFVSSLDSIRESTMDYSAIIFLHQRWNDKRLRHNYSEEIVIYSPEQIARVWRTDLYIDNAKKSSFHRVTSDNIALRVYPNGEVFYSMRISLQLFCQMDVTYFLLDIHECKIIMLSYAYRLEEMKLTWKENVPALVIPQNQVPQFTLVKMDTEEYIDKYGDYDWSFLAIHFHFKRNIGYYILTVYTPTALLTTISWISFWLNVDASPARTVLGTTTILTITTMNSNARGSLPEVSYTTAMDVWMSACICLVLAAMLEFAAVNYLHIVIESKIIGEEVKEMNSKSVIQNLKVAMIVQPHQSQNLRDKVTYYGKKKDSNNQQRDGEDSYIECSHANQKKTFLEYAREHNLPLFIDKVSRVIFPLFFLFFNIIYWCYYTGNLHSVGII